MDDTSSLPTTNIINLSYDRSKFFLVFFFFFKKKNRSTREKTCKEVELLELKVIVYDDHLCLTHQVRREKKEKERNGTKKEESKVT